MGLPDILLALLHEPMSGSDLIGLFRVTISHFWSTDLSQIYRALDGLEEEGSLRSESVPSARGPARNVYRLTRRGSRRVAAWLQRPPRIPAAKFEYLAQLFSVMTDGSPRERARAMIEEMREEAARDLSALEAIEARLSGVRGFPRDLPAALFYPWLTLRHGLLRRRAFLEWIDECLGHLDARPAAADRDAGPGALPELLRLLREGAEEGALPVSCDDQEE
jgi:DNA-binding PadR family transcriptional regulator